MAEFTKLEFTTIKNSEYNFFKLYIDGQCPFDEFEEEVSRNDRLDKRLKHIYSLMDNFSSRLMLPKEKFRQIEGIDDKVAGRGMKRNDVFEFKKDDVRVYVLKAKPNIFIVLGGAKKTQKKDIARLNLLLDNLKIEDIGIRQEYSDNN